MSCRRLAVGACPAEREDETYVVLEGELTFQRGDERPDARAGDVVLLPRGVVHGFAIGDRGDGDRVRRLRINARRPPLPALLS